ncbi:MAG: preprotein translocase subunit YajC [Muribaculaceae bacterium]|nr:preprotein translocase subunit YajC [Muribaculaceae bacterium]
MLNTILLQAAGGGGAASGWSTLIMIAILILIFYFFMMRPQSQKQKKIAEFRSSLKNGDKVMTAGGIYGKIREVKDKTVLLEVADGVRLRVDISSIYQSMQDVNETGGNPKENQ